MRPYRKRGSTSVMVRVFIPDNTLTTGAGCTGLTSASTNLVIAYVRELDGTATTYSGANIETITTVGTYAAPSTSSKIRFKAVDATNFPGLYELQFHDSATAFGTGDASRNVTINILETSTTALKIGPNMVLIPLSAYDISEGQINVVAVDSAALSTHDTGMFPADVREWIGAVPSGLNSGLVQSDVERWKNQIVTSPGVTGVPKVDLQYIEATALDTHDAGSVPADVRTWVGSAPNALVSGRVDASTGAIATDAITASAIAANAIGASEFAADAANEIADSILSRNVSNVEAIAAEHTLCTAILAMLENSISGTTLTIKRTDGSTTHFTKTLTTDAAAQPITGIT